ncbi:hypothetical protein TSUD_401120 [Trifolium subterraneum]|uniref:Reverse transcriptase zinc-binding domain-containing protein n=1 Tax=Trifolium subterraneum TaxID=3900 RepID=A0A2Z6PA56_TRISU|nr:hypothetical protein TSUD_401120 [Trifolium subterraneum]
MTRDESSSLSGAPSKVSALAWQLLLNRILTRDNLCYRGIIGTAEASCPLCGGVVETSRHLFLHCNFAAGIWYALSRWLGVVAVLPPNVSSSYAVLVGWGSNSKRKKGFSIVWLAFVWAIWKARNDRVFNNKVINGSEVVDFIQHRLLRLRVEFGVKLLVLAAAV